MNIIGSLKLFWYGEDSDAAQLDPTQATQTNVPSRPNPWEPMPSTRLETTSSSTCALRAGHPKPTKGAGRWLQQNDPMAQDPIELSDDEESPRVPSPRMSRSQVTRHFDPQPPHRDTTRATSLHRHSNTDAQGTRVPENFKTPVDAVFVPSPGTSVERSTMSKYKPGSSRFLKPMNTLDDKAAPARGSKGLFISQSIHRTSPNASKSSISTHPKGRNLSLTRNPEPPRKKLRMDNESPDILQGSKSTNVPMASRNNTIEDLSSTPRKPARGLPDRIIRASQSDRHSPTDTVKTRKLLSPWPPTMSTDRYVNDIIQPDDRAMSDEEDDRFIKEATNERRRRERFDDDDIKEISYAEVPKSSKVITPSRHFSLSQRDSPTREFAKIDSIIPDSMLQLQGADASSPDAIQEDFSADRRKSTPVRKHKAAAIDSRSSPGTRKAAEFQTPAYTVSFRPQRMLFGGAPADVSNYLLSVDKTTRTFSIRYDGNLLGEEPLLPSTRVDKILKITHGAEGSKVKIETSEINVIGHEILLELNSHKRVFDLVNLLVALGTGISVFCREDAQLDRVFDNFVTLSKRRSNDRKPAQDQDLATRSPYFSEPRSTKYSKRHDHSSTEDSYIGANSSSRTSRSQASASMTQRRQRMLEEDYNSRETYEEPVLVPSDTNGASTRSRPARSSIVQSPPKPSPYSQSGKLGERWKNPLTYPRTGKKRASVDFDDLSRLDDDEFLNDNLIGFFVRYIEHYLEQEKLEIWKKSYFFNSYFYEKLRQNPKDKKNINYEGVKKWTDKIDLFSRDFVVVPVNENLHWYVAIICNLSWFKKSKEERDALERDEAGRDSAVTATDVPMENTNETRRSLQELTLEDQDIQGDLLVSDLIPGSSGKSTGSAKKNRKKRKSERPLVGFDPNRPAIVTLDSLGMARYTTASALKQYIAQEAKERLGKDIDLKDIQGLSAKKIPMQGNYSDCGLFVCAYLERFAKDPTAFKKQELERIPQQWPELHSHDLRSRMRDLIVTLHDQQENKNPSKDLPSVGEILLPPITPSQSLLDGAAVKTDDEDETIFDLQSSPAVLRRRLMRGEKRSGPRDQPSDSEDELIESHTILRTQNGLFHPQSLQARTAKILSSPVRRFSGSLPLSDSDEEREVHRWGAGKDNPRAMAKRLKDARSPEPPPALPQHIRSDSVSTEFLNGNEGVRSYEVHEEEMHVTDHDNDDEMLIT